MYIFAVVISVSIGDLSLPCDVCLFILQSWQSEDEGSWLREYPVTLMQFLLFLYHNQPDFVPLCMSGEFLAGLAATLFPYRVTSESNSEVSSPVEEFKVRDIAIKFIITYSDTSRINLTSS